MPAWISGENLFYCGIALVALAAAGIVLSFAVLSLSKKKLKAQLDKEYGNLKQ